MLLAERFAEYLECQKWLFLSPIALPVFNTQQPGIVIEGDGHDHILLELTNASVSVVCTVSLTRSC